MDDDKPVYFAPIPIRASRDKRLSGLHFRILAIIAAHCGMEIDGYICWIGRKQISIRVGCDPTSLSRAISELITFGYIDHYRHPDDGRRKGYRVHYIADQDA